jgi:hypothetical protein
MVPRPIQNLRDYAHLLSTQFVLPDFTLDHYLRGTTSHQKFPLAHSTKQHVQIYATIRLRTYLKLAFGSSSILAPYKPPRMDAMVLLLLAD